MKIGIQIIVSLLLFFILGVACNQVPEETIEVKNPVVNKPLNPNGDSELAILMREMFEEAKRIKKQVQNGETVTVKLDHEKILSAHATEPDKAASPKFKSWASAYLAGIESLKNAKPYEAETAYRSLVNNCLNCHKSLCPGPIVRINKLKLPRVKPEL